MQARECEDLSDGVVSNSRLRPDRVLTKGKRDLLIVQCYGFNAVGHPMKTPTRGS